MPGPVRPAGDHQEGPRGSQPGDLDVVGHVAGPDVERHAALTDAAAGVRNSSSRRVGEGRSEGGIVL